jgi:hypothetical protein
MFDLDLSMSGFMTLNSSEMILAANTDESRSNIVVKLSRRNHREVPIKDLPVNLRTLCADHYDVEEGALSEMNLLELMWGVSMNGRAIAKGTFCEFSLPGRENTRTGTVQAIYYRLVENVDEMVLFKIAYHRTVLRLDVIDDLPPMRDPRPPCPSPCPVSHVSHRSCGTFYVHADQMLWHVVFGPSLDGNPSLRGVVRVAPMHQQ